MRYSFLLWWAVALLSFGCAQTPQEQRHSITHVPSDTVLVVVDDPRPERLRTNSYGVKYNAPIAYAHDPQLKRLSRRIAQDYNQEILLEWPLESLAVHCFVIRRPDAATLARLERDSRVRWVQPFNTHMLRSASISEGNDAPPKPLPVAGDASGVRLTVIDTGADLNHQDLANKSIIYKDLVGQTSHSGHDEAHGTSILGLLAAQPRSDGIIEGFATGATFQHLRGCWEEDGVGQCNTFTLALALEAAIDWRPAIVNLSLSGPSDRVLDALIERLTQSGTLIVSAFDEERSLEARFPAPSDHVVYAMAGQSIEPHPECSHCFVAPGHAFSLSPMNEYRLVSGHSVATPYLTATFARLVAQEAKLSGPGLIKELNQTLNH